MKGTRTEDNNDSSSSSAAEPKRKARDKTRSPKRLAIQISDDDDASKRNDKGNDKGKDNDNTLAKYSDKHEGPPECKNRDHPEGCHGLYPTCQLQYVGDLKAWRKHVQGKLEEKNASAAASSSDTQLEDDTQLPDF